MKSQREAGVKIAYTVAEAAEMVGLSPATIKRAIRAEKNPLPAKRSGEDAKGIPAGRYLILHDDLVSWVEGLRAA